MPQQGFEEVFAKLAEPIPDDLIGSMKKGRGEKKQDVDYISWYTACDLLDERAPGWEVDVVEMGEISGKVYCRVAITLCGIRRVNVGHEDAETDSWGDPFSNAYAQALKRTAMLFLTGARRQLYDKAPRSNGQQKRQGAAASPIRPEILRDPKAKTMADLVTPRQLVAVRAIAHTQRVNAEDECLAVMKCKPEELSKKGASALIDHLKGGRLVTTGNLDQTESDQEDIPLPEVEDPATIEEWACSPERRRAVVGLRKRLKEWHKETDDSLNRDMLRVLGVSDITKADGDTVAKYTAHLSKFLNEKTKDSRKSA